MTGASAPLLLALAATGTFLVAVAGLRMARGRRPRGLGRRRHRPAPGRVQRQAPASARSTRWRTGSLAQLAILLGPTGPRANLRRRIDLAGRPDGMTVDTFLQLLTKYAIVLGAVRAHPAAAGQPASTRCCAWWPSRCCRSRGWPATQRRRQERIDDRPAGLPRRARRSRWRRHRLPLGAGPGGARFAGPLHEELMFTLHQLDVGVPRRQAFIGAARPVRLATRWLVRLGLPAGRGARRTARGEPRQIALDSRREAAQPARRRRPAPFPGSRSSSRSCSSRPP